MEKGRGERGEDKGEGRGEQSIMIEMTPKRETRLRVALKTTRWPSTPSPPLTSSPSSAASPSPFTTWPSTPAAPSLLLVASTHHLHVSSLYRTLPRFISLSLYLSLPLLTSLYPVRDR